MIETETVRAANAAYARLTLPEAREAELPIELNQLQRAIEGVSRPVAFEAESAGFRVVLQALAVEQP